jgi:hypothetical protein
VNLEINNLAIPSIARIGQEMENFREKWIRAIIVSGDYFSNLRADHQGIGVTECQKKKKKGNVHRKSQN